MGGRVGPGGPPESVDCELVDVSLVLSEPVVASLLSVVDVESVASYVSVFVCAVVEGGAEVELAVADDDAEVVFVVGAVFVAEVKLADVAALLAGSAVLDDNVLVGASEVFSSGAVRSALAHPTEMPRATQLSWYFFTQ
jgi:hypothetical protein